MEVDSEAACYPAPNRNGHSQNQIFEGHDCRALSPRKKTQGLGDELNFTERHHVSVPCNVSIDFSKSKDNCAQSTFSIQRDLAIYFYTATLIWPDMAVATRVFGRDVEKPSFEHHFPAIQIEM